MKSEKKKAEISKSKHSLKSRKSATKKTQDKHDNKKLIYLDNNGTTLICPSAERVLKNWLVCYNPSSNSRISKPVRLMIDKAKRFVLHHCYVTPETHTVLFTSGATESNCFILRSTASAYKRITGRKPHIVTSAFEHHSILECAESLENDRLIDFSLVLPNSHGIISPRSVERLIRPNTCLVSIMHANNEIGSLNDISAIGKISRNHRIPFHSDCVQTFGKIRIGLPHNNLDAISASLHKLYGPKGIGLLIINNDLIKGYQLRAQINGSQQGGLRGGTENVPAIISSMEAIRWTFSRRKEKNKKLLDMRNQLLRELRKHIKSVNYSDYMKHHNITNMRQSSDEKKDEDRKTDSSPFRNYELVILGPPEEKISSYIPNTLFISLVKLNGEFCNVKFKELLDKNKIIVSIGSACLTGSSKASHVLDALGAPDKIRKGIIRISTSDYTKEREVSTFIRRFLELLLYFDKNILPRLNKKN
jgi:cysteine desulfurase